MAAALQTAPANLPFVQIDRATKKYGAFRLALAGVSLAIQRSEFVLVLGGSGAGKSTLLRLLGATEAPTSGSVRIGGEDPMRMRPKARALLRRSIGVVMQQPTFLDDRSVIENVMLPAIASNQTRREALARARAALGRARFEDVEAVAGELSSGARHRVALARAIVNRPALLLVDDPISHLDPGGAAHVMQLLEQFAISGVTVVMAAQREPDHVPARTRLVRLDHGVLAA